MSLKRQIAKGSLWALLGTGGQQLIGFAVFIYVARILNPALVGLVAFALIGIEVAGFIARCGQVEVLQREGEPSQGRMATSFWISLIMGLGATLVILGGAQIVRLQEPDSQLPDVLIWLAPLVLLQGLSVVPEAVLRRRMDYRTLAIRNWIATIMGGVAAIAIGQWRPGVDVLIGQRLTTAVVQSVLMWTLVGWTPSLTFVMSEARKLVTGGLQILVASLSGILNGRISDGITGIFLGATTIGLLRVGSRFFDMIVQVAIAPISSLTLSSFNQLRDDLPALRRAYVRMTQINALVALPMVFGLGAVAHPLLLTVFGEKWLGAAPVLRLLPALMLPATVNYFFASAMIAVGRSGIVMRQSLAQLVLTVVMLLIGVQFGLIGVMIAFSLRAFVVAVYNLTALRAYVGIQPLDVIKMLAPPTVACAAMWLAVAGLEQLVDTSAVAPLAQPHVKLGMLAVVGAITYAAGLLAGDALGFWRGYVGEIVALLRSVSGRGPTAPKAGAPESQD